MNNRKLAELSPLQLVLIVIGVSLGSALGVLLVTRLWNGAPHPATVGPAGADRIPPQPDFDIAMQANVPSHFSEDLVIPGFTATGADVESDDDGHGRSPEGV